MSEEYDVVIVGAGPAGEHAAGRASRGGLTVAVVEHELFGGECSYWACIPSKTLLRPGHVVAEARNVPGSAPRGWRSPVATEVLAWRDEQVSFWHDDGQISWLEGVGAAAVRGHGRLAGERRVIVEREGGTVELIARRAVILATGSTAAVPPIEGLADVDFWTNREATAAGAIPRRLAVLGGGVVGVELAQAFRRLGSEEVVILEAGERLVANVEPFVGDILREHFEAEGISVRTEAKVVRVERSSGSAGLRLYLGDHSKVATDQLLVAAGRRPRSDALGLEELGLVAGEYVPTGPRLQVQGVPGDWLYAIGDLNGKALLTHMGKYQARVAIDAILGDSARGDDADERAVTSVIFTDPEVGTVGVTEAAARAAGLAVRIVTTEPSAVAAGSIWGRDVPGRCQLVVDASTDTPIGATFVGPTMSEALHAATIAVVGRVPLTVLRDAVPAFPTLSEVWLELIEAYFSS